MQVKGDMLVTNWNTNRDQVNNFGKAMKAWEMYECHGQYSSYIGNISVAHCN